jgi:ferredoxin, 2Fe-2S
VSRPRVRFIEDDGTEHVVEAEPGQSLMLCAQQHLVPGVLGDCGGCCTCGTCHGYVDFRWMPRVGPPNQDERLLLDGAEDARPNSRLTCQIEMTPELDGLIVRLPRSQR